MARSLHLAWALALGACFTGGFLAGQPCTSDGDCGPMLRCEEGVCGGRPADATTTGPPATTGDPTTTTTGLAGTATGDPTTDPTTSTTAPLTTGPDPSTSTDGTTGPGCGIGRCKDIDLLMVIDDSPSMGDKSPTLLAALIAFGDTIVPALQDACSVHIGITTTGKYANNPPDCQLYGALVRADINGNECQFIEGLPYATLPDLADPVSLVCPISVGSSGDPDEAPIDAMLGAFKAQVNRGCNEGFLRPESFLTVILVTDEDDDDNDAQGNSGSNDLPENLWYGAFTNLKGSVDDMYMVGLFGDDSQECAWLPDVGFDGFGAEPAPHLLKFIQAFPEDHYAIDTLCKTPEPAVYAGLMNEMLAEITTACEG